MFSAPAFAGDKASQENIDSENEHSEPKEERGSIMLPHDMGQCTSDLEGAIHYNTKKKVPETCTPNGWRVWGEGAE